MSVCEKERENHGLILNIQFDMLVVHIREERSVSRAGAERWVRVRRV